MQQGCSNMEVCSPADETTFSDPLIPLIELVHRMYKRWLQSKYMYSPEFT